MSHITCLKYLNVVKTVEFISRDRLIVVNPHFPDAIPL